MRGFNIRTAPLSYYKDSSFIFRNKGRTAIDPNFFICVLDGFIGLFAGCRSAFDLLKTRQKSLLAGFRMLYCSEPLLVACQKVLSGHFASLRCSVFLSKCAFRVLSVIFTRS